MKLEAEAFLLGIWTDFEEMEWHLTMEELQAILDAKSRQDMRHWKFQASLKGIPLDDLDEEPVEETGSTIIQTVDDKRAQLAAAARGIDRETFEFSQLGIAVEKE